MIKLVLTTAAAVVISSAAMAANFTVTEIALSGIKKANGTWFLATEGGKVTGKADMQLDNGTPQSYKIDGKVEGGAYVLNLTDRTDGKKDCVWTGKPNESGKVYEGQVVCGSEKFTVRASAQ